MDLSVFVILLGAFMITLSRIQNKFDEFLSDLQILLGYTILIVIVSGLGIILARWSIQNAKEMNEFSKGIRLWLNFNLLSYLTSVSMWVVLLPSSYRSVGRFVLLLGLGALGLSFAIYYLSGQNKIEESIDIDS